MATEQHEPKQWDLYRTPTGNIYLIPMLHTTRPNVVRVLDLSEGVSYWFEHAQMEGDEFIGNVLALPGLVDACLAMLHAADHDDPMVSVGLMTGAISLARSALRDAGVTTP